MQKFILILLSLGLFWACTQTPQQRTLSGTIIGADGNAPAMAHVHLLHLGAQPYNPLKSVTADSKGHFSMPMPQGKAWYIYITAADHKALLLPLLTKTANESTELTVQPMHNQYVKDYSQVKITGDWNRFSFSNAQPLQKQADGTFVFETKVSADTAAFQLYGLVTDGRTVNGTNYDGLVYDGGGDYRSIVKAENGTVHIVFDPKKLKQIDNASLPRVEVTKGDPATKAVMKIAVKTMLAREQMQSARAAYLQKNGSLKGFDFDRSAIKMYLKEKMANAGDALVQRFAALELARQTSPNDTDAKTLYKQIVSLLPLSDPLWEMEAMSCSYIYREALGEQQAQELFKKEVQTIPNRRTKAGILISMAKHARDNGDTQTQRSIYNDLKTNYADLREIGYYVEQLNPDLRIAKGNRVPDFTLPLLNSSKTISNKKLLGKYYIMDFWATWCGPCVGEMPKIHEAYEKYKSPRFTILSLSFDRNKKAIEEFRKNEWKMPWLHVYLEGANRDKIGKEFEVSGIPKPILVDPKGVIVAMEGELCGDQLDVTLRKFLGK